MSLWQKIFKKKADQPLPMHPNNVLLVSSSARQLHQLVELLTQKHHYTTNSDVIRLDNGDFAQVVQGPQS